MALTLPAGGGALDPAGLFGEDCGALWLEIGFGGGEHLAWQLLQGDAADRRPGIIGAEYFINGIASLLRQVEGSGGEARLRIYQGDARDLLDALPDSCLDRVFVLFPDPWPKTRHHKRRIIQPETVALLSRLMKPGAELRIATDDPGYLRWILSVLQGRDDFLWQAERAADWRHRPGDWPPTRYETKALAQGRRPAYLVYRRQ